MNNNSTAIVPGSLGAIAQRDGLSVAESFLSVDVIVIVDTSGSMDMHDARGDRQRFAVACEELARLQRDLPGKIGVVAFSDKVVFVPGGVPPFLMAGTDLANALRFVQPADGCVRFVVISDGQPNSAEDALRVARTFQSRIDTVYVGSERDHGGADFLARLAAASGGQHITADRVADLAVKVEQLMLT